MYDYQGSRIIVAARFKKWVYSRSLAMIARPKKAGGVVVDIGDLVRSERRTFERRPLDGTHFYMSQIIAVLKKTANHGVLFVALNFL